MAVDGGGADDEDHCRPLSALRPHHRRRDLKIDSDGVAASSALGTDEFVNVKLSDISKEVQCPICLGIIRKTRTVMECLHRFCRECIDKSMRLGNNECPACRTHCASRRSLRDDPNYDTLIAILYPDIDKYEEEELAFRDEEKNRNKQIQSSIAQTLQRQTEALVRRNATEKATTGGSVFVRRSRGSHFNTHGQNSYLRARNRTARVSAASSGDDSDDTNNNEAENFSSSADEPSSQNNARKPKRWSSHRFSSTSLPDGGYEEGDDIVRIRNNLSASPARAPELRSWGRGATRSHTRFGSSSASGGKNSKNTRLARLLDHFQSFVGNEFEFYVHLTLLPLDKHNIPSLERSHLCCHPTLSMRLLQQFISLHIPVQADDLEILINTPKSSDDNEASPSNANLAGNVELSKCEASQEDREMLVLKGEETVAMLIANAASSQRNLVLLYRPKLVT